MRNNHDRVPGALGIVWVSLFLLLGCSFPAFSAQIEDSDSERTTTDTGPSSTIEIFEGQLKNNTVYDTLLSIKIPPTEIIELSNAFKPVFDFRCSRPKDTYQVCVDSNRQIRKFVYKTSLLDEYEATKGVDGGYRVFKREIKLNRQVAAELFTIGTSLCQAVEEKGETQKIASLIAEIFAWDIDFYLYPRKGDRIAVVFERCYKNGAFVKYGNILAARYVGRQDTFSAFYFNDGEQGGYYDATGQPLRKMFLRTPVKFGKMTSRYSIRRFHPVSKRYKAHTGIDYGAPMGTPIFATANGRVLFAGRKGGYGKLIIVKHPNGYQTYYGHCSRLLKKKGAMVEQGQVIARVGKTGVATGPHVHYEVRVNGKPINPNTVKKSRGKPLNPEYLADFKQTVSRRSHFLNNLLEDNTNLVMLMDDKEEDLSLLFNPLDESDRVLPGYRLLQAAE
jgi:murein DD-endopeptidase MepM/ murein hydrolase activator NlpD